MPPFPGGDHQAVPGPDDGREVFRRYRDLFALLRGKRWLLHANALRYPPGAVQANIFATPSRVVVPVVFGAPGAVVEVTVRGFLGSGRVRYATRPAAWVGPGPTVRLTLGAEGEAVLIVPLAEAGLVV